MPPVPLLRGDSGCSTSQNVFLDLSGRGLGKFLDESYAMRGLEVSEVGPRKFAQLSLVGLRPLSQNDKGVRRFAPAFVRQANNCHFLHRRVPQENAFDLNGRNVFDAANDDVFQPVADLDKYRMRSIGWRVRFLRGKQNWKRRDLALSLTRDLPITRSRHHRPM